MTHASFVEANKQAYEFTPLVQLYIPIPPAFSGCTGWWDASAIDQGDGTSVEVWPDSGPNHYDLVTPLTNAPLLDKDAANGRPALLFDGVNDRFSGPSETALWNTNATGTCVVVYKIAGAIAGDGLGYLCYTGLRGCYDRQATGGGGFVAEAFDAGGTDQAVQAAAMETWHIGVWTIDGPLTGPVRGGVDNPNTSALASTATGAQTIIGEGSEVFIGGLGGSDKLSGYIAEIACWNRSLSEAERQEVVAYMAKKYSLAYPGSLPVTPLATGGWVDVGDDVVGPVKVEWGIHGRSPRDRVAGAGTMTFKLDNSTNNEGGVRGYYSPGHKDARVGFVIGVPARLVFFHKTFGTKVRWQGTVESARPGAGTAARTTSVACVDWMEEAARAKLSGLAVQVNTQADELLNTLLAATPKPPPNGTSIGSGSDVYPYALDTAQDESSKLQGEFQKIAASEFGFLFVEAGTLVFESRQTRSGNSSVSLTLDEDTNLVRMTASNERDDIINRVQVAVHPRRRDAAATTQLFQLSSTARIERNTSITMNCPYRDPNQQAQRVGGVDMVAPVATTDYTFNTLADGSGADITSQLSVTPTFGGNAATLVITNNGPLDGYVTSLKLRGRGLYDFEPVISDVKDATSVATYGENPVGYDMPYQVSVSNAADVAAFILGLNKGAETRVDSVTFLANWDATTMERAMNLRISERVAVVGASIGVGASNGTVPSQYFINGVRMDIATHAVVTITLDLAPADTANYWVLEVPGRTELDATTVLGYGLFVAGWILDTSQLGTDTFLN